MVSISLFTIATALTLFAYVVVPSPLDNVRRREYAIKSSRQPPRKWKRIDAAPLDHVLQLQIGLKQSRIDDLLQRLDAVSDPKHNLYGNHLSAEEVQDLVRPSTETMDIVSTWLSDHGIDPSSWSYNAAGDWISVELPVHQVNQLLDTEYSIFEHEGTSNWLVRTPEWSLPAHLHDHIDVIEPTNSFLRPQKRTPESKTKWTHVRPGAHEDNPPPFTSQQDTSSTGPTECNPDLVTPGCLRSYYSTLNYTVKAADKNRMAVANYLGELSIRSDLSQYLSQFRPEAVSAAEEFQLISINNGTTQQFLTAEDVDAGTGGEGALDVQSMLGIAWPTPLISYSTGGSQPGFKPDNFTPENTNEPYLVWVQHLLDTPDDQLPYVVSTSYADNEQTVSPEYAKRVCESFAQLGARGVSLFFSSGDDGVGADGTCFANEEPYERKFMPEFPSSCPYVTTVGGTYLFEPEVAVVDTSFRRPFYSGGGFSEYFPLPEYQKAAVSSYLSENNGFPAYTGLFNPAGRAYPDVSAQSLNFSVIYNSGLERISGTSASTPAFTAIIALVNDALLAAGKPTMGFLNPWLYGGGFEAFRDVLSGSSTGCETEGFPAARGWDAVTGWGTPDFPSILAKLGLEGKRGGGGDHGSGP